MSVDELIIQSFRKACLNLRDSHFHVFSNIFFNNMLIRDLWLISCYIYYGRRWIRWNWKASGRWDTRVLNLWTYNRVFESMKLFWRFCVGFLPLRMRFEITLFSKRKSRIYSMGQRYQIHKMSFLLRGFEEFVFGWHQTTFLYYRLVYPNNFKTLIIKDCTSNAFPVQIQQNSAHSGWPKYEDVPIKGSPKMETGIFIFVH